jgi:hypothetical protein
MKRGRKSKQELLKMANQLGEELRFAFALPHRFIKIKELKNRFEWLENRGIAFSRADNYYLNQLEKEVKDHYKNLDKIKKRIKNGFCYNLQVWIKDFIIQDCWHTPCFDCGCNSRKFAGRDIRKIKKEIK